MTLHIVQSTLTRSQLKRAEYSNSVDETVGVVERIERDEDAFLSAAVYLLAELHEAYAALESEVNITRSSNREEG